MEINKWYQGDCMDLLKVIPDSQVDLVIADPPYNIGIDEWDNLGNTEDYLNWFEKVIDEIIRVTKRTSSIYIFGDYRFIANIKVMMDRKDVKLTSWIIWDKGGKEQNAIRSYANITEHILFYTRPKNQKVNPIKSYLNEARIKKGLSLSDINRTLGWATTGGGCASGYMGDKEDVIIPSKNHYNLLKNLLELEKDYEAFRDLVYKFN